MILAATLAIGSLLSPGATACYLPPVASPIVVPFVMPACPYCPGHRGVEYHPPVPTSVHAAAAGIVTFAGMVAGIRYVVVLQHDGLRATYGMLAASRVASGSRVSAGQVVATSGSRLYFGLRTTDGSPVDPTPLLAHLRGRTRLVPTDGSAARPPGAPRLTCAVSSPWPAQPP